VEVVGVLRDEEPELAEPLELDEGQVGCVGLDLARRDPPPWRWKACVASCPYTLGTTKVWDARVGADTRAREGDDILGPSDPPGDRLDVLEALFVCHAIAREAAARGEDGVSSGLGGARSVNSMLPHHASNIW
jgi:hypothetical protein